MENKSGKEKLNIRLAGSGGQGLILASIILATVAAQNGKYVAQSQSYGPEARGGASRSELIISDEPIDYPLIEIPDFLLSLTEEAYDKYGYSVKDDAVTVVDDSIDYKVHRGIVYSLPIIKKARIEIKSLISANVICIGVISELLFNFEDELIIDTICEKIPSGKAITLTKAFNLGKSMIKYHR